MLIDFADVKPDYADGQSAKSAFLICEIAPSSLG